MATEQAAKYATPLQTLQISLLNDEKNRLNKRLAFKKLGDSKRPRGGGGLLAVSNSIIIPSPHTRPLLRGSEDPCIRRYDLNAMAYVEPYGHQSSIVDIDCVQRRIIQLVLPLVLQRWDRNLD